MKTYCKQVAPEYQESPLFYDDFYNDMFPDNIAVCGNKDYKEHLPDPFKRVREALKNGELAEAIEDIETGGYYYSFYKNVTEAINDLLYPEKAKYSAKDIHALKRLTVDFLQYSSRDEDTILCSVLSIVTGETWSSKQIHGFCQSDWNYIFYPVEQWDKESLAAFESEYFNTGTEWIINDGEFDPENDSPENINGCSVYCTAWNEDGIKKEIADSEGVDPADIVLYAFEGYTKTSLYKEV